MKSFRSIHTFRKYVPFIAESGFVHAKIMLPVRQMCSAPKSSQKVKNENDSKSDNKNNQNDGEKNNKDNDKNSDNNTSYGEMFKNKYVLAVGVGITFMTGLLSDYSSVKEAGKDALSSVEKLSFAIRNAEIKHSRSARFVSRPKIEVQIERALTYTCLDNDHYTIVYGPNGVGKSELVDHTAIGKKGVIKVEIYSASTRSEIILAVTKKLLGETAIQSDFDVDKFIEAIQKCGTIPTIIFDVERDLERSISNGDDVLRTVRKLSKKLAPYCRCIIVLSDVNAVVQFGKDEYREKFIYVDEMEREEAEQFLEKLQTNITKDEMKYVFEKIGTSPSQVLDLAQSVSSTHSVEDYVADILDRATRRLRAFPHQAILQALKDHPEGISLAYFDGQESEGVDLANPVAVGTAMKAVNAIVYREDLGKYMLMSTAHRTALESYEPMVRRW